jgi:peptidoglycan hydrolase CwlO-like protein
METSSIAAVVLGGVISLFMWLLSKKDESQQNQINLLNKQIIDLYNKHEDDAKKLQSLELQVARDYNSKDEIQSLLGDIKKTMAENFDQIRELFTIHLHK